MRTKNLTTAALLTALCVVFISLSCVLPAGSWVMLVAAAMIPALAVIRCGLGWAALCYAAAAALTLLLFPGRLKGLLFVCVLGHYGVFKSLIERIRKLPLEWALKLLLFNAAAVLCWVVYVKLFAYGLTTPAAWVILLANCIFVIYDLGFTAVIGWYLKRFPG